MQSSIAVDRWLRVIRPRTRVLLRNQLERLVIRLRSHRKPVRSPADEVRRVVRARPGKPSISRVPALGQHFRVCFSRATEGVGFGARDACELGFEVVGGRRGVGGDGEAESLAVAEGGATFGFEVWNVIAALFVSGG